MIPLPHLRPFLYKLRYCLFLAVCCVFIALPAHSQQAQLDALAAQTAQALQKAHTKSVIVLDFSGPGFEVTQLGRGLADQFSSTLSAASAGKFKVLDRSHLAEFIQGQNLSPLLLGIASNAFPADEFGAKALIWGELSNPPGNSALKLSLHCFNSRSRKKKIAEIEADLPLTTDAKSLLLAVIPGTDFSGYAEPGKNGVTLPGCEHCPTPPYTDEAFRAKIQGEVVLGAVITPEGKANSIVVLKRLPHGLTDSAINEVKRWKFKPSLSPDGNPVATWTLIEVDFHIR